MTVTVCNGKGGSGKTTVSILLAAALAEAGHDVAVLDTDPQQTASQWINDTGGLTLAQNGKTYGTLIIDTPPRLESQEVGCAIQRGDVVVVVSSPSPADLFTSRSTAGRIADLQATQRSRILFNNVQPKTVLARELADMADLIGLGRLKSQIHRRQAYQHAVVLGWKSLPMEAREEIFKVALEITAIRHSIDR
jgi:chromosome partitioning protein